MEAIERKVKTHGSIPERQMTRNQLRLRKMAEQKLMGIVMLVISAVFLWMCSTSNEDCGAVLILAPLGLLLLFSRKILIV